MDDAGKSKKQLLTELIDLRRQIAQLETSSSHPAKPDITLEDFAEHGCRACGLIPHALCMIDSHATVVMANNYLEALLGYPAGVIKGRKFGDLIGAQKADEFKRYLATAGQGLSSILDCDLLRRDGSPVPVNISAVSVKNSSGKEMGFLLSISDVTDHKRLVGELALGATLLDSASDSIFLRNAEGNFIYVNEAAYKTRDFSREEMLKANIYQVVAPEYHATVEKRVKDLFRRGRVTFEAAHLKKDGSAFPVEVNMSLVELDGRKMILSVVRDISLRKRIEADLLRGLKLQSVAGMAANILGQFNSLLIRVISNLSVLLAESDRGTQHYKLLEETEKSAALARNLARQLLSFTRLEMSGKRVVDLAQLLRDAANFILSKSNAWCNFNFDPDLQRVEVDEGLMTQAISNIILNASQSMPRGGVIDIAAANIHLDENDIPNLPDGDYVRITVKDNGKGIAPEHLDRVFDPYFTTNPENTGLGLSVAYSIIKTHEGAITIESKVKKGTTVRIFLPAAVVPDATSTVQAKEEATGVTILIIDDDAVVRSAGTRMLHRLGYENIEFALEGQEALDKYGRKLRAGKPYDVVILDLTIPGRMSGRETIKALLQANPEANIIVSSGYFDDPMLGDFRRHGLKGALSKPYRFEELKLLLQEILEKSPV